MTNIYDSQHYDDIIHLPHHVSTTHAHMTMEQRAAQFSPFAALSGYEEAVSETERLTDARPELDEEEISLIDQKLRQLQSLLPDAPEVTITYFVADERKDGGACVSCHDRVKQIDLYKRIVRMEDRTVIPIDDILFVDGIDG